MIHNSTCFWCPRQTNLELCLAAIADRGYASQSFLLDALWFGLPQSRRRVYIVCLSIRDRNVGCSAEDFLSSVQSIITKLYLQSPPAEPLSALDCSAFWLLLVGPPRFIPLLVPSEDKFLLPDTHALVKGHLRSLEADRQQRLAKEQEQDTSKAHPKNPSWMALHMNVAEKRALPSSWCFLMTADRNELFEALCTLVTCHSGFPFMWSKVVLLGR